MPSWVPSATAETSGGFTYPGFYVTRVPMHQSADAGGSDTPSEAESASMKAGVSDLVASLGHAVKTL